MGVYEWLARGARAGPEAAGAIGGDVDAEGLWPRKLVQYSHGEWNGEGKDGPNERDGP